MKSLKYSILLGIAGYLFGIAVGCGNMYYIKKSQRDLIETFESQAWGIICGVGGVLLGLAIGKEDQESRVYGFDTCETLKVKDGRKWAYYSKWVNPETNNQNTILTAYDKIHNKVITKFNDQSILIHDSSSGSEKNISQIHYGDRAKIFKKIKLKEFEQI
jgi:hypothetical protein